MLLEQQARGRSLPARLVERSRIVLRASGGLQSATTSTTTTGTKPFIRTAKASDILEKVKRARAALA